MRQNELESCALPNVSWISDRCLSIPESSCSGRRTCNVRVFGLVFPDPACLVIINNNKDNDVIVTVQAQNFFDSPRYYGTVFVLFFTIVGGMAILANVAYQFYTIIVAPVGKHQEQIKIKRDEPTDPERAAGGGASGGGGGSAAGGAGSSANGGGVNGVSGPSPLRPAAMVGKLVDKIKDGLKRGGGDDDKRQA
ncbi:hypothetical protein HYH03_005740 [Edaphochlamys debaryana]|uniref:Uncharacterized protein n=1 Tax=Edaphochlamys debaryana TaxID=47281 RepID=A0A836C1R8_9CHLO|nr:hypothetical protein HYH03_005740 [Edaphochlamys debaryana]|eukprot:KAG2496137.1 hypothetical protein HYH03_005740 [Edaphochlamys debaryana]